MLYEFIWHHNTSAKHVAELIVLIFGVVPNPFQMLLQVRSVAAESDRAYQGGPLERSFYQEASLNLVKGVDFDVTSTPLPYQYASMLDWFAVDLEGEHSAMDGRILEEHTDYVVYAIHRV